MFTKTEIRNALSEAMDINSDSTERTCSFSLTGISDGIMLCVYLHGKKFHFGNKTIYIAYNMDGHVVCKREFRQGISDGTTFPSLKEMLKDMKGVGT